MTTNIYILIDPITNEIRYVGKTNTPKRRFYGHIQRLNNHQSHKRNWINKLKKLGHVPILEVIDEVNLDEWRYWECFYIAYFKMIGCKLTNHTGGGDGVTLTNKGSFKKGQKPWNDGITHSKETCELIKERRKQQINNRVVGTKIKGIVNGQETIYPSVSSASRATGVKYKEIYHLANKINRRIIEHPEYSWEIC